MHYANTGCELKNNIPASRMELSHKQNYPSLPLTSFYVTLLSTEPFVASTQVLDALAMDTVAVSDTVYTTI